ncbi:MAG: hypothetical protein ACXVI5_02160 [Halobacteriota archaeon]
MRKRQKIADIPVLIRLIILYTHEKTKGDIMVDVFGHKKRALHEKAVMPLINPGSRHRSAA